MKGLHYGSKNYQREYAIKLLNRIIKECKDLTPQQTQNERFELEGDLHTEIYNFLVNHDLLFGE